MRIWINLRMGALLSSRVTGDDVLRETFLQAHRSVNSCSERGPDSIRDWLFSVADRRIRDLGKHPTTPGERLIRGPAPDAERDRIARLAASVSSPSSGAHRQELVWMVIEAIRNLPPDTREVFILRVLEERSLREIGEKTGRSLTTVETQYVRALRRLKDEIRRLSGY